MLIRTQSKTSLVNADKVNCIYAVGGTTIQAYYSENDQDTLGTYSTEEKAIKVLDMIQNKYLEYYHLKGGPAILKGSVDVAENMWEVPKVFQMPIDEEV